MITFGSLFFFLFIMGTTTITVCFLMKTVFEDMNEEVVRSDVFNTRGVVHRVPIDNSQECDW